MANSLVIKSEGLWYFYSELRNIPLLFCTYYSPKHIFVENLDDTKCGEFTVDCCFSCKSFSLQILSKIIKVM